MKVSENNKNQELIKSIEDESEQILNIKESINALSYVEKDVVSSGDDLKELISRQRILLILTLFCKAKIIFIRTQT